MFLSFFSVKYEIYLWNSGEKRFEFFFYSTEINWNDQNDLWVESAEITGF